ncbi:MAG: ABC transporter substrate-binding protein, partial [Athalassotoga sp.]
MKKSLVILMILLLVIAFVALAESVVNPDTIVEEEIGPLVTLDPVWAYDTASGEAIFQLYNDL